MHLKTLLKAIAMVLAVDLAGASADEKINFNRDIRPILSGKCFQCHGPDSNHREADLRLDVEESAKADQGGSAAIVPGKPDESALIARIVSTDEDERMPPADSGKKLSLAEIDLLRQWIAQGAPWSKHWAYIAPKRHHPPRIKNSDWPVNWIDHFILGRLQREGLQPSPEADRVTLIRRLFFDLSGLPPTPGEVDEFVGSQDEQAYEKLVDRLLASDRYGERMAIYWLDLVRYADTVGYHGDQEHRISPYRDYVIDAFNSNMPLDRFTREQLAGDLLPGSSVDQKIASSYNRLLQTSHEGGVQRKEYLAIYMADRIRNLSGVWLGATMGCCQCHDHKYDPLTMKDFYSLQAIFADLDEAGHLSRGDNVTPTLRAPEIKVLTRRERQQIAEFEQQIKLLEARSASLAANKDTQADDLKKQLGDLKKQRDKVRDSSRKVMVSVSIKPRPIRLLPRGNWLDESGPIMRPEVPGYLGKLDSGDRRATRLDLANWLTDPKHGIGGMTARVMANRFWYLMFGVGIAKVLDDFGGQGEPPVHPELLDSLAVKYVESGWNTKQMIKLLVMSRAYRQSSLQPESLRQRDPYNQLHARQSRFRLPAEMVRDNALAISGLIVLDYGGASIKPYQPAGYYRHLNFPKRKYHRHTDSRQWRRGVYMHWQRQFLHPMLKAFDAPSREECTAQRPRSNTPIAAMTLLNDPTFVEAARVFAEHIMRTGGSTTEDRLDFAFRRAVSRKPNQQERVLLGKLLAASLHRYQANPTAASQIISTGQAPLAKDLPAHELAAWTAVARGILCLHETMTRN